MKGGIARNSYVSGPVEQKKKEKTPVSSSSGLSKFSPYMPYKIYYRVGIACRKIVY